MTMAVVAVDKAKAVDQAAVAAAVERPIKMGIQSYHLSPIA